MLNFVPAVYNVLADCVGEYMTVVNKNLNLLYTQADMLNKDNIKLIIP